MNKTVDEENGGEGTKEHGLFQKLRRFSRNEFWKSIGCILSAPTFVLGRLKRLEKDSKIYRKKRKRSSIRSKVDLYEVCASLFQTIYYYYYFYTNNSFPSAIFLVSLNIGESILGIIGQEA